MCNGHSSRTSQGGSIAVLRLVENSTTDGLEDWRLFFSNEYGNDNRLGTRVQLQGDQCNTRLCKGGCWIVIHRYGDLSNTSFPLPPNSRPLNPFFSFDLDMETESVKHLPQRLDLGVGDLGIIGRKVSVMTSSIMGPKAVAEGIIGWN